MQDHCQKKTSSLSANQRKTPIIKTFTDAKELETAKIIVQRTGTAWRKWDKTRASVTYDSNNRIIYSVSTTANGAAAFYNVYD